MSRSKEIKTISISIIICLLLVTSITVIIFASNGSPPNPTTYDDEFFTIVEITDTQEYVTSTGVMNTYFKNITQWIVDNQATWNIQYVVHSGDLIFSGNTGVGAGSSEWSRANQSMKLLDNANIPYGFSAGNHDMYPYLNGSWIANSSTYISFYEPYLKTKSWWGGSHGDNMDNYQKLTIDGYKFLFLNIHYNSKAAINWAESIIQANPDYRIFVTTHAWLWGDDSHVAGGGWYHDPGFVATEWFYQPMISQVLAPYDNVFMVMCGHMYDIANMTINRATNPEFSGYGKTGNLYYVMSAFDFAPATQDQGWFTLITFYPNKNKIHVQHLSPYANKYNEEWNPATHTYTGNNVTVAYNYGGGDTKAAGYKFELWLDYDMTGEPGFLSICGMQNNSNIGLQKWYYNGTKINDAIYYQIQCSNNSIFSDVFMNISGINETSYGTDFDENATRFYFIDVNKMSSYGKNSGDVYARYRAYTKRVTE